MDNPEINTPHPPEGAETSSTSTPKESNKWLKMVLLAAFGLVLAGGLVFAGYKLGQRGVPTKAPQPTSTSTLFVTSTPRPQISPTPVVTLPPELTPTPDPTVEWKRFDSDNFPFLGNEGYFVTKFSLKLPPETNFQCDMSACWEKSATLPTGARLAIIEGGKGTLFPNETWSIILKSLQDNSVSYSEITVDDKPAIKITEAKGVFPLATPAYEQSSYGTLINLESKGRWMSLFIYRYETEGTMYKELPPTSEDIALFDQILSTSKFLE